MGGDEGLICAYLLDGEGNGTPLDWNGVRQWSPEQGLLWVHLDYSHPKAIAWLEGESQLAGVAVEALLAEDTRPRSAVLHDGLLAALRGVNLNPGAEPEDMVALRMWLEAGRIISSQRRRLLAVGDLRQSIERGDGPSTTGAFLGQIAQLLALRIAAAVDDVADAVDALEEEVMDRESHQLRPRLADVRRKVVTLRRYLAPQREAMMHLLGERVSWLSDEERLRLREVGDVITREVEDLDEARDRATVTQEELNSRLSEQMEGKMYLLSLISMVFLPISFVTGLLGVNVGGIPGAEFPHAFALLCALLAVIAGLQVWLFRHSRFF